MKYRGENLIITGDFNLPQIDWKNWSYGPSISSDLLVDIMLTFSLQQVVRVCTRENILDLLLLSEMFSEGMVEIEPGISDPKLISFTSKYTGMMPDKLDKNLRLGITLKQMMNQLLIT